MADEPEIAPEKPAIATSRAEVETIEFSTAHPDEWLITMVLVALAGRIVLHAMSWATDQSTGTIGGRLAIGTLGVGAALAIVSVGLHRLWGDAVIDVGPGWLRYTRRSPLGNFSRHWRLGEITRLEMRIEHLGRGATVAGVQLLFVDGGSHLIITSHKGEAERVLERVSSAIVRFQSVSVDPLRTPWLLKSEAISVEKSDTGMRLKVPANRWRGRRLGVIWASSVVGLVATFVSAVGAMNGWLVAPTTNVGLAIAVVATTMAILAWFAASAFVAGGFATWEVLVDATRIEIVSRSPWHTRKQCFSIREIESLDVGPYRMSSRDGQYFPQLIVNLRNGRATPTIATGDEESLFDIAFRIAESTSIPVGHVPPAQFAPLPNLTFVLERQAFGFVVFLALCTMMLPWGPPPADHGRMSIGRDVSFSIEPPRFGQAKEHLPGIDFRLPEGWHFRYAGMTWREGFAIDPIGHSRFWVWIPSESRPAPESIPIETIESHSGVIEISRWEYLRNGTRFVEYRFHGKNVSMGVGLYAADEAEVKPMLQELARSIKRREPTK